MVDDRVSAKIKMTFSLDAAVAKKIKGLAIEMSPETSCFGGQKNNQTAVIVEAVNALWLVRHPEER